MLYIKNRNLNVIKLKLSDKHFKNEGHDLDHTDYAMILCGFFFVFNKFSSLIFWLSNLIQKCAFNLKWQVLIDYD